MIIKIHIIVQIFQFKIQLVQLISIFINQLKKIDDHWLYKKNKKIIKKKWIYHKYFCKLLNKLWTFIIYNDSYEKIFKTKTEDWIYNPSQYIRNNIIKALDFYASSNKKIDIYSEKRINIYRIYAISMENNLLYLLFLEKYYSPAFSEYCLFMHWFFG